MSKVISAEVSDEVAEQINEFRDGEPPDYDESRSAAVKRLIRRGLRHEEGSGNGAGALFIAQLLGWVMFAGAFFDAQAIVGYVGALLVLATVLEQRYGLVGIE